MITSIDEYLDHVNRLREYEDWSFLSEAQYELVKSCFDYIDKEVSPILRQEEKDRIGQFLTERGWDAATWLIYNTYA
jgi:hypothetical protein